MRELLSICGLFNDSLLRNIELEKIQKQRVLG